MAKQKFVNKPSLETLVRLAGEGRRDALEELVRRIQDRMYRLAIRTLFLPADAEDATQEILIKIITHLADFRGESRFSAWCFRIAANQLLTTRKRRAEKWGFSFRRSFPEPSRLCGAGDLCGIHKETGEIRKIGDI
jgi:DNA-directed RNA polymerase specialized sigma24 family protein